MNFRNLATAIGAAALMSAGLFLTSHAESRDDDAIKGEGPIESMERPIEPVTRVELATQGTLFIEIGDKPKLVVDAQANLQEAIVTDVRRGELSIETARGVSLRPTEPIEYHLTVPSLEELVLSSSGDAVVGDVSGKRILLICESSGDMEVENIQCPELEVELASSGDMTIDSWQGTNLRAELASSGDLVILGGSGQHQDVELSSSGDYDGEAVETRTARVRASSSGDAHVRVQDQLDAETSSSGDIIYSGHPDVRARSTSSGDIESSGL